MEEEEEATSTVLNERGEEGPRGRHQNKHKKTQKKDQRSPYFHDDVEEGKGSMHGRLRRGCTLKFNDELR